MASDECNKGFCSNYMLLDPKKATLPDIFCLLFSSNLNNRKFVDSSQEKEKNFRYRVIIFFSILVLYLLQLFSKPMAWMGSFMETMINLLPSNGGFYGLIMNIIRGRNVIPDRDSETFVSIVGNLDTRMQLDHYLEKTTTQAFLFQDKVTVDDHDDTTIVVTFRGTELFNSDDWCSDFDLSWYELPDVGKIHSGFMKALGLQKSVGWPKEPVPNPSRKEPLAYYHIRDILRNLLSKNERAKFIVTGHSLGGALAALFPAVLFFHDEKLLLERLQGVFTFGQPRVGDEMFGNYMENNFKRHGIEYYRFVYGNDMVARVPFDDKNFVFKHFGSCVYYNSRYEGEIVKEEPFKNYFSIRAVFPMITNAMYELLRSFTIVKKQGSGFREGYLQIFLRLIGLVVPGLPAHSPMDYVNSTRLEPHALFPHY
ncbi:Lipase, class 3 [Corchorus olitorius]|uniref:Lipase, class 3 n=1 Tax=Corchorus olitorius TaxID=93759 RepID=A0A1R3K4M1_9ROSI|nr:Lipase, class 3 [Corchorus olitorius]